LREAEERLAELDERLAELQDVVTADAVSAAQSRQALAGASRHVVITRIRLDELRSTLLAATRDG
jgi:hypothetical protein